LIIHETIPTRFKAALTVSAQFQALLVGLLLENRSGSSLREIDRKTLTCSRLACWTSATDASDGAGASEAFAAMLQRAAAAGKYATARASARLLRSAFARRAESV